MLPLVRIAAITTARRTQQKRRRTLSRIVTRAGGGETARSLARSCRDRQQSSARDRECLLGCVGLAAHAHDRWDDVQEEE